LTVPSTARNALAAVEGGGHGKTSGPRRQRASGSFRQQHSPRLRRRPDAPLPQAPATVDTIIVIALESAVLISATSRPLDAKVTERPTRSRWPRPGSSAAGEKDVKILGDGEITRAIKVTAAKILESAKAKIEKAAARPS